SQMVSAGTADRRGVSGNRERGETGRALRKPGAFAAIAAQAEKLRTAPGGSFEFAQAALQHGRIDGSRGQTQQGLVAVHERAQNPIPVEADLGASAEILEHAMTRPSEQNVRFGGKAKGKEREQRHEGCDSGEQRNADKLQRMSSFGYGDSG